MVLNASIAVQAVNAFVPPAGFGAAPFTMALPNLPPVAPPRPIRKQFRTKKYCLVCGWRKKEHYDGEGKGGKGKCNKDYCGNCYRIKAHHGSIPFGPECIYPVNAYCSSNVKDWYEYKASYYYCYCLHCYCCLLPFLTSSH